MARPIKETPILLGEDARRFEREIKENESRSVTKDEYDRAVKAFKKFEINITTELD